MTSKYKNMNMKSIEIFIPTKPVSASRPRVSSYGTYYSKSYMNYRKETHMFLI